MKTRNYSRQMTQMLIKYQFPKKNKMENRLNDDWEPS